MLDHLRRWWRVLAVAGVAEFALGALIAGGPQYTFEFWAFMLSMWTSATLISFDFRRGLLRPVAVLPLTGRQMGRAWWLATVPIPAIVLAALLFSGAGIFCYFGPNHPFPTYRLVMASLFTSVWLGLQFTLNFVGARGFGRNPQEYIRNSLLSVVTVVAFFGTMLLCNNASNSPLRSCILLGIGALLTVAGWVLAEQFDPARAGLYLGRIEPPDLRRRASRLRLPKPKTAAAQSCAPGTGGGLRFLLSTVCVRGFLQIAGMVALMALLWLWQGRNLSLPMDFEMLAAMGSFMPCWFIVFYSLLPLLRHLRVLRTLPISATELAGVLLALALLPPAALGMLLASVGWLFSGPAAALAFLKIYALALGGVALCVFFAVWRGAGVQGYALLLLSLFGFLFGHLWLQGHFHYSERTLMVAGSIATGCILLALVLTRLVLVRGSRVYREETNPSGGFPMAASQ
ncbi:MAG TPA: hypothetical protein VJA21_17680 [Verrucomicrobiae bacterium]